MRTDGRGRADPNQFYAIGERGRITVIRYTLLKASKCQPWATTDSGCQLYLDRAVFSPCFNRASLSHSCELPISARSPVASRRNDPLMHFCQSKCLQIVLLVSRGRAKRAKMGGAQDRNVNHACSAEVDRQHQDHDGGWCPLTFSSPDNTYYHFDCEHTYFDFPKG